MFIAVDVFGKKVEINDVQPGGEYYCPLCKEKLSVKNKGKIKAPHFAHPRGSDCADWGDMSEWHLNWQEQFPIHTREVVLEKDGERHRADVCIEEYKLVIEFQHSPISAEEFERRCLFYTGCGYQLVWVFDAAGRLNGLENLVIQPLVPGRYFHWKEFFERNLEWKRKNNTFRDFPDIVARVAPNRLSVYLETPLEICGGKKILAGVKTMDEKYIKTHYTCQYIFRENFLKENAGLIDDSTISIRRIICNTQIIQKQVRDYLQQG